MLFIFMNLLTCEVSENSDMSPGLLYAYTHVENQIKIKRNKVDELKKNELNPADKENLALLEENIKKLENSLLEIVKKDKAMKDSSSK